jgi:hypothetical protein
VDASGGSDDLETWCRLTAGLNLAGANYGERREAPAGAPRFAGVVEHLQQDHKFRELIVKIDQPLDGMALVGSFQRGDESRGLVVLYLYGDNAAAVVQQSQEEWSAWLKRLLAGEKRAS